MTGRVIDFESNEMGVGVEGFMIQNRSPHTQRIDDTHLGEAYGAIPPELVLDDGLRSGRVLGGCKRDEPKLPFAILDYPPNRQIGDTSTRKRHQSQRSRTNKILT